MIKAVSPLYTYLKSITYHFQNAFSHLLSIVFIYFITFCPHNKYLGIFISHMENTAIEDAGKLFAKEKTILFFW